MYHKLKLRSRLKHLLRGFSYYKLATAASEICISFKRNAIFFCVLMGLTGSPGEGEVGLFEVYSQNNA